MNWESSLPFDPAASSRVCLTLAHSVWQVGLLAAIACVVERLWCGRSVVRAYWLYVAALVGGLAAVHLTYAMLDGSSDMPSAATVRDAPRSTRSVVQEPAAQFVPPPSVLEAESGELRIAIPAVASSGPIAHRPLESDENVSPAAWQRLAPWLAALYAAGVTLMLVRLLRGCQHSNRLARGSTPIVDGPLAASLNAMAQKWSMRVMPVLARADQIVTPKVVGLVRPTILLPASVLTGLPVDEVEILLAHELAHVRRCDLWVNLLQRVAETLLFFNPPLWLVSRRISTLREYCCDEMACRAIAGSQAERRTRYAQALLHVVELSGIGRRQRRGLAGQSADVTALAASGRSPSELRRRVARLFGEPLREPIRISPSGMIAVAALAVVILIGPVGWRHQSDAVEAPPAESSESTDTDASTGASQPPAEDDAATPAKATISGRIVLEDGSPATSRGWLYSETMLASEGGTSHAFKTEGQFTDRFSIDVPAGTVWLKYFGNDFAPAWVGPLEVDAGEARQDVTIEISSGFSSPIRVRDESGAAVAGAMLIAHPLIGDSSDGPNFKKTTDERGEHVLEHVANTYYTFRVTAPGYEPLQTEPIALAPGEPATLTMQKSLPTTGIVLGADGSPAAGAKIRFRYEAVPNGTDRGASYGFGEVWATTDEAGRFTLDQLTRTSRYLFVVETADNARVVVRDIRAGQEDVRIDVPERRDLLVGIVGSLDELPKRNGKPFISVRQVISIDEKNLRHTDLIGEDTYVTPTDDGGVAHYEGLVEGTVRVTAGKEKQTVEVADAGLTEVMFQTANGKKIERKPGEPEAVEFRMRRHRPAER